MPKVPTYQAHITPEATGPVPTVSPQTAGLVGQTLAQTGWNLARTGFALDEARKQVELQKALNEVHGLALDYETESLANPDWETAPGRAQARFKELEDKYSSGLKDPRQQEEFRLRFGQISAPMAVRIKRDAHGKMIDAGRAGFFEALTNADRDYSHAGSDPERQTVLDYAQSLIRSHVDRGFLTAQEGVKTAETFLNQVHATRIEALVNVDPVRALEELNSGRLDQVLQPKVKVALQAQAQRKAELNDDDARVTAAYQQLADRNGQNFDRSAEYAGNPDHWKELGLTSLKQTHYLINVLTGQAADQRAKVDRARQEGERREMDTVFGLLEKRANPVAVTAFLHESRYLSPEFKFRITEHLANADRKQESDPIALSNLIASIMKDEVLSESAIFGTKGIHPKDYPQLSHLWQARQPKKWQFNYVDEATKYFSAMVTDKAEKPKFLLTLVDQMRKQGLTPEDPKTFELAEKLMAPIVKTGPLGIGFLKANLPPPYQTLFDERPALGLGETITAAAPATIMSADLELQPMNATQTEDLQVRQKLFHEQKELTRENKQRALAEIRGETGMPRPGPGAALAAPPPAAVRPLLVPTKDKDLPDATPEEIQAVYQVLQNAGYTMTPANKQAVLKKIRAKK